jgi:PAS domain S-box-containing protein
MSKAQTQDRIIAQNVLENMSDGVAAIDLSGTIITFNVSAAKMLQLERDEVLGRKFVEIFFEHEGCDEFNQVILDAMYEENLIHNRMVEFHTGENSLALFITTSFLHQDTDGRREKVGVIAVFRDVTEVKQLRDAEQRLTEELHRKHRELQDAYLQVEESNTNLKNALKKVQVIRIAATAFSIILFVGLGLYSWNRNLGQGTKAVSASTSTSKGPSIHAVAPQSISSSLQMTGSLEPINVVNVTSPFNGKVQDVLFHYGEVVKAGQVLFKMDTTEIENKLSETTTAFIKASERLKELDNWDNGTEVARSRRSLSKAKLSLESQKRTFEETERLYKKGIVPATEYESARQQFIGQQMDYQSAEEELKATIDKANPENRKIARLEMKAAQARLKDIESQSKRAVVTAPVAGVIIVATGGSEGKEGRRVERGSSYMQGDVLFPIGDLSGFSVKAKVDEVDVVKIKPGQRVKVTGDAFRDTVLNGKVRSISSQANKSTSGGAPSFDLVIAVDGITEDQRKQIYVGMSANIEIILSEKPNAIMVPVAAVKSDGAKRFVVMKSGERRDVDTGETNLDSVEIIKGLKAGDEIVL